MGSNFIKTIFQTLGIHSNQCSPNKDIHLKPNSDNVTVETAALIWSIQPREIPRIIQKVICSSFTATQCIFLHKLGTSLSCTCSIYLPIFSIHDTTVLPGILSKFWHAYSISQHRTFLTKGVPYQGFDHFPININASCCKLRTNCRF